MDVVALEENRHALIILSSSQADVESNICNCLFLSVMLQHVIHKELSLMSLS